MTLERDYTLQEVAEALAMSERWLRIQIAHGLPHLRYGQKIRFTREQVDHLRRSMTRGEMPDKSITTGRGRRPR